jgi:hypothetical protein
MWQVMQETILRLAHQAMLKQHSAQVHMSKYTHRYAHLLSQREFTLTQETIHASLSPGYAGATLHADGGGQGTVVGSGLDGRQLRDCHLAAQRWEGEPLSDTAQLLPPQYILQVPARLQNEHVSDPVPLPTVLRRHGVGDHQEILGL